MCVESASGAVLKFRGHEPAQPCSPDICKLPDCRCSGTDIPGNLPPNKVPQMVMLTFDDAVNDQVDKYYQDLFGTGELKNPNGCTVTATFFVSHEYTEYQMVQALYHNRHDIADHTISHRTPTSWWKSANYSQLTDEIAGQREILRKWGQVKAEDVVGFRVPFLQLGGNTMYQVLHDNKFLYDSSMPTQKFTDPPMWPYTLDYRSTQECVIPPCPTGDFTPKKSRTWIALIILSADRFEASNFPRKHTGIWLSSVSKEWEIWTLPGWGENFNRNCHSVKSFSGKHVFYLLIRKSLKEKSSLSRADGSEEKVYKFVSWVEHKNPILAREGRKFVQTNLQKFKCQGGCPGGMLKLRIDQHITCPTVGRESQGKIR